MYQGDLKFNQRLLIIKSFNKNLDHQQHQISYKTNPQIPTNNNQKAYLSFNKTNKPSQLETPIKKQHYNNRNTNSIQHQKYYNFSEPRTTKNLSQISIHRNISCKQNQASCQPFSERRYSFHTKSKNYSQANYNSINSTKIKYAHHHSISNQQPSVSSFTPIFKQLDLNTHHIAYNHEKSYQNQHFIDLNKNKNNNFEFYNKAINIPINNQFKTFQNNKENPTILNSIKGICTLQEFYEIQKNSNHQFQKEKIFNAKRVYQEHSRNRCKTELLQQQKCKPELNQNPFKSYQQISLQNTPKLNAKKSISGDIDNLFMKIQKLKKQCNINTQQIEPVKNIKNENIKINKNIFKNIQKSQNPQKSSIPSEKVIQKENQQYKIQIHQVLSQNQLNYTFGNKKQSLFHDHKNKEKNKNNLSKIRISEFNLGKKIGSGKFGDVFMCIHKKTKSIFALKKILKSTIKQYQMQEQFIKQLKIHYQLNHPNIINLITHFDDQFHVFLIMEYAEGGSLMDKIKVNQEKASKITYQLVNALQYTHSLDIVHRDIKPENLVVFFQDTVKLCDFGWSTCLKNNLMKKSSTFCGTPDYVSPQMKDIGQYNFSVDLWSLGVLSYQMVAGYPPFKNEVIQWVKNGVHNFKKWDWNNIKFPIQFSEQLKQFIIKLLKQKPNQRVSLEQCKKLNFIRKHTLKKYQNEQQRLLYQNLIKKF